MRDAIAVLAQAVLPAPAAAPIGWYPAEDGNRK
jgi:hypothetical protein